MQYAVAYDLAPGFQSLSQLGVHWDEPAVTFLGCVVPQLDGTADTARRGVLGAKDNLKEGTDEEASDGFLHLTFQSQKDRAMMNAIELVPGNGHKLHPIRFVARETGFTDNRGQAWSPESYALGGRIALRQQEVVGTADPGLYQSERYGNFSYAIPVAPGTYTVTLHFAETWHGPNRGDGSGAGSRVFDVQCNGVALLESFDIFKEAGRSFKAVEKRFTGLKANAQGKLNFTFVSQKNYALVNAIEVLDEGN